MLQGKRPKIAKGSEEKFESHFAANLASNQKNKLFGFQTLQYTVSEACGTVDIKVLNKTGNECSIGIRTVDKGAKAGKDYVAIPKSDQIVRFNKGEASRIVSINIIDDEQWNEDREFYVELWSPETKQALFEVDCKTVVLIIDDDKPGNLAF